MRRPPRNKSAPRPIRIFLSNIPFLSFSLTQLITKDPRFRHEGSEYVAMDYNTSKEQQREATMERIKLLVARGYGLKLQVRGGLCFIPRWSRSKLPRCTLPSRR